MKRIALACALLCGLALFVPAAAQDKNRNLILVPQTEGPLKGKAIYTNSHALLIGVNEYPNLPKDRWLSYAVKDVEALKDVLVNSYGFPAENVKTLVDGEATLANIKDALASYADKRKVQPDDRILIYFSGHGQTVKLPTGGEMGFILPYDAKVDLNDFENAGPYLNTCIGMDTIKNYLDTTPAKHTLVLADACYSGLLRGARAIQPSAAALAALAAKRASQIITAGRKGEVSIELANLGHGAFTYKLIEELKARAATPGDVFHAYDLYSALSIGVANVTEGKQSPTMGDLGTEGQFFFIVAAPGSTVVVNPPAQNAGKPQNPPAKSDTPAAAKSQVESVETVARIKVDTNPPGAKIFIDDQEIPGKLTPATIEVDLGRARSKDVEIAVELGGYKAAVRKATVVRGANPAIALKLDKAAAQTPVQPPQKPVDPPGKVENPPAAAVGAVNLTRNFKEGASIRAKTDIELKSALLQGKMDETFRLSVASVSSDGTATLKQQSEGGSITSQLGTEASPPGPPQTELVDRMGRVTTFSGGENAMFDADTQHLIGIVTDALVPGRPVGPGETWKTTLANPAQEGEKMTLTGKLLGSESVRGVSAWKIQQTGAIDVGLDSGAKFQVDMTFWVHPMTGLILRAEGTLVNVPTNVGPMVWKIKMQALEIN